MLLKEPKKNNRLEKIDSLIQHELSLLFTRMLEPPPGSLISIGAVKVTPDLETANVPISILPFVNRQEVFKWLTKQVFLIQQELNGRLKTYRVPKIHFVLDETEEHADRIGQLLDHPSLPPDQLE